jgi:heat shock protein 5
MLTHIEEVILNINLTIYDISVMIPIGGTAIAPALQAYLLQHFYAAIDIRDSIPSQSVIATGLAKVLESYHDPVLGNYTTSVLSLGIRTAGGIVTPVIHRISILPAERSLIFTTVKDNQECAIIELYEGDRLTAEHNKVVTRIVVESIPLAKRGIPKVCAFLLFLLKFKMAHFSTAAFNVVYPF